MGFTSSVFLFAFLPISLLCYWVADFITNKIGFFKSIRFNDVILVFMSAVFYAWSCADHIVWLFLYIIMIYFLGMIIYKTQNVYLRLPLYQEKNDGFHPVPAFHLQILLFAVALLITLTILLRYKYSDFFNRILNPYGLHVKSGMMAVAPMGISFIVFSSVSYLADIKNGKAQPGTFLDCMMYLTFFPKIISGPIVLWRDFKPQIGNPQISLDNKLWGMNRICIGFAKKVLLADIFGFTISQIEYNGSYGIDTITVWITVLLYMLQIYYDFAGYSDIAIGLSQLLGISCKNNFNFPYRSLSITEFWRRWHISLGTWFKEYVYIPLGGSRKGLNRTMVNLTIVFMLTGFWHGAGWNYILWGAINTAAVLLDRLVMKKHSYAKVPSLIKWAGTMFIVMLFWQLFRYPTLHEAVDCIYAMFHAHTEPVTYTWKFFLDQRLVFLMVVGILGSTVLGSPIVLAKWQKYQKYSVVFLVQELVLLVLVVLSIISVVSSTYSPFIYFQY